MINLEQEFVERVVDSQLDKLEKLKVELVFSGTGIVALFLVLRDAIIELPLDDSAYRNAMELVLHLEDLILEMEPDFENYLNRLSVLNDGQNYEYKTRK